MLTSRAIRLIAAASFLGRATAQSNAPANFPANPNNIGGGGVGGSGGGSKDSAHFRIYGAGAKADAALRELEGAYACFVEQLGWRSSGLSKNAASDSGPFYKLNVYAKASIGGAAGVMKSAGGYSYIEAISSQVSDPRVIVHEYGHALTYHEKWWVDQTRTGPWWEPVANWFADTYLTSPLCADARAKHGRPGTGPTLIELNKVIGSSHQVIVDGSKGSGNYYQSWPLITYLTNNPDNYPGLGKDTLRSMIRRYRRNSNDTPLHALQIVAGPTRVQTIVGRYWARMAYVDIGHPIARERFEQMRGRINYANLDRDGDSYRVRASRAPRYMGANIIPLKGRGTVEARVTASRPFTATFAVKSARRVRYVDLVNGQASVNVGEGEEASLVVVNTPANLINYDAFAISGEAARGLEYTVRLRGASA